MNDVDAAELRGRLKKKAFLFLVVAVLVIGMFAGRGSRLKRLAREDGK